MPKPNSQWSRRHKLVLSIRIKLDKLMIIIEPLIHLTRNQLRWVLSTHLTLTCSSFPLPETNRLGWLNLLKLIRNLTNRQYISSIWGNIKTLCTIRMRTWRDKHLLIKKYSKMVFLGVPSFAFHTTSILSGPLSAVTMISSSALQAVQVILLHQWF